MEFTWLNIRDKVITQELLDEFQSGNSIFDSFLKDKAGEWQDYSEASTYVFVTTSDCEEHKIRRIYGYVSINATGLMYSNANGDKQYLSCAEIRMFAIHKSLRKKLDPNSEYSEILFKMVLQKLYYLSTHVMGFRAVFLNSNDEGYSLYTRCGFSEITDYIAPEIEEKIDILGTTPLLLLIFAA